MTKRIMFAGGGTGGHLFPAFAIAEEISNRLQNNCEIRFFVTGRELERRLIGDRGYRQHKIHVRGIKRGSVMGNALFPMVLTLGIIESIAHIIRFDPDFVVGTGGYLAFPAVLAAKMTHRPAFIQEQNSHAGIASRRLARFADLIFIAYEDTARQLRFLEKCILAGNPIRARFGEVNPEDGYNVFRLDPNLKTVLIFGGSQGAASINEKIATNLSTFSAWDNVQFIWQVGENDTQIEQFNRSGVRGTARKFIDDMPAAYAVADLVICRSGALTLAEVTASGRPAILIPFPHATEDHQTTNAQVLVDAGAALVIKDSDLASSDLAGIIYELLGDEGRLTEMTLASSELGRSNAAQVIVQRIFEYMGWR
jgi:UDP-N-acetylglucosamine--N-acetylmuramyl-(pentapeptide) pyrophosphoryl-undecaprenol N-acetylglucosamine transferase